MTTSMTAYVLVLLMSNGWGGLTPLALDMPTREACEAALANVRAAFQENVKLHIYYPPEGFCVKER